MRGACHGLNVPKEIDVGGWMYPRAAVLTCPEVQWYSDLGLFSIVKNGIRLSGMPAFGKVETDEHISKLVHYLRTLPAKADARGTFSNQFGSNHQGACGLVVETGKADVSASQNETTTTLREQRGQISGFCSSHPWPHNERGDLGDVAVKHHHTGPLCVSRPHRGRSSHLKHAARDADGFPL
jgi:hypothetical protein